MKQFTTRFLLVALAYILVNSGGAIFAQNYDNFIDYIHKGPNFTIKPVTEIVPKADTESTDTYVIYSGREISFGARTSLQKDSYKVVSKDSVITMYNSGAIKGATFPILSNMIPASNANGVTTEKVYVFGNVGGVYAGVSSVQRGDLTSQLCGEAHYKEVNKGLSNSKPAFNIFYTIDKPFTQTPFSPTINYDKLFKDTNKKPLIVCHNYYIAYCGDKIVDVATDDGSSADGKGGIIIKKIDGTTAFTKRNLKPTTNEVCDSTNAAGAACVNGTPGCCKADCTGFGGGEQPSNSGLNLTKTLVTEKNYSVGDTVDFKINFKNEAAETLTNVSIEDFLPAGFEYVSSEIVGATAPISFATGIVGGNFRVAYTGFSLSANQAGYVQIKVKLLSCTAALNNVFWQAIKGTQTLSGSASKQVNCSSTPLSITKTATASSVVAGQSVLYTIVVNNATPNPLTNVFVKDIWPINGCIVLTGNVIINRQATQTAAGNTVNRALSSPLAPGDTLKIDFWGYAQPRPDCIGGPHNNVAQIIYGTEQANSAPVGVTITQGAQGMGITKTLEPKQGGTQTRAPGDEVVFTIKYTNTGTNTIYGFTVTDMWPDSLEFISAQPAPISSSTKPLTWQIGALEAGKDGIITILGKIRSQIQ